MYFFFSELSADIIHLSISGLSLKGILPEVKSSFLTPTILQYNTKNLYVLIRVSKNLFLISFRSSSLNILGRHGGDELIRYHRNISAPYLSITSNGFTMLPTCFDIFCPVLSSIMSLTIRFLYALSLNKKVPIACSE